MEEFIAHPLWPLTVFLVGACIGSFLNVAIYRIPLGLGVSDPKRSFCPHCKKDIPWFRNLPLLTWLLQRGKCAECGAPIAFRYFFVELITALLFLGVWMVLPEPFPAGFFAMALCVLLIVISFIDAEHMVIPVNFTYAGMVIGVIAGVVAPGLVFLSLSDSNGVPPMPSWFGGGQALMGIVVGWGVLALVVRMGKFFFGERRMKFDEAETWSLREPESDDEELSFMIGDERLGWSEVFYRKTDRIEIEGHGILLDGKRTRAKQTVIRADRIVLDGEEHMIEKIQSLAGKADRIVIPREAMGGGIRRSSA